MVPNLGVLCLQTMAMPSKGYPRLKAMISCGVLILELAQQPCYTLKYYFEELLAYFFSSNRIAYNHDDCCTLLECINNLGALSEFDHKIVLPDISVLKYFLSQLLTHDKRGHNRGSLLNLFLSEVRCSGMSIFYGTYSFMHVVHHMQLPYSTKELVLFGLPFTSIYINQLFHLCCDDEVAILLCGVFHI